MVIYSITTTILPRLGDSGVKARLLLTVWVLVFLEARTHHVLHNHIAHAGETECILEGAACTFREVGRKKNFGKAVHGFPVWVRLLDYMHRNLPRRHDASAQRAM
jgi:hypothetical protein